MEYILNQVKSIKNDQIKKMTNIIIDGMHGKETKLMTKIDKFNIFYDTNMIFSLPSKYDQDNQKVEIDAFVKTLSEDDAV